MVFMKSGELKITDWEYILTAHEEQIWRRIINDAEIHLVKPYGEQHQCYLWIFDKKLITLYNTVYKQNDSTGLIHIEYHNNIWFNSFEDGKDHIDLIIKRIQKFKFFL